MTITFKKLHPLFAAQAIGFDLSEPLTPDLVKVLDDAMSEHAVLVIRGQPLTERQEMAVGEALGTIESKPATVGIGSQRLQDKRMNDISNLGPDGSLLPSDDERRLFNLGNRLWHTDSSFKSTPAKYSMLYAQHVPTEGGDTEFADMRASWDALDPALQTLARDCVAMHSLLYSRALLGFDQFSEQERLRYTPVRQRLVRRHPGSGRLSLYLAAHIGAIENMLRPEAMVLVQELIEHSTQRQFVYKHGWKPHDLVIWDNRCTMHRATRFDDKQQARDLRRVTVQDSAPTLEQPD